MIRRCRAGQIVRAAAGSYRRRAGVLITIGLVYLPVSILVGASASVLQMVPLMRRITALAGNASETSVLFARLAGGAANVLTFVAVNAMVAAHYDLRSSPAITASSAMPPTVRDGGAAKRGPRARRPRARPPLRSAPRSNAG